MLFADASVRTHELFAPNERAAGRRSRRYNAIAVVLLLAMLGGGVAVRAAKPDRQPFMDAVLEKTVPYWRQLVERVSY